MLTRLLLILLPVVLPFALYFIYYLLTRSKRTTVDGEQDEAELPWIERGPWAGLFLAGVVLSGMALAFHFSRSTGPAPGDSLTPPKYTPPSIEKPVSDL
ncbi:hypothetical protein [Kiloniella laminariae]|uniref:hypothetical protein n=1 Tax=Kiloniella laminariae TaxID=454162 RepID=UPI00036DB651|nr:hypothetical protein [Kiloniella laminariae]